ncbi:hypothetical protein [Kitasatospora sp. NPDC058046]|uniref:hypothetical protein n=1 Tax=Kitasatospora sp. NPDC058046 TaxID=3346312 RepID=UPI0036DD70AA
MFHGDEHYLDLYWKGPLPAGIPVHARTGSPETPTQGSRTTDAPPWYAGADLTLADNSRCSTGIPGWVSHKRVLLTAAHCQTSGHVYNGQRVVGEVTAHDTGLDVAVITTDQTPRPASTAAPGTAATPARCTGWHAWTRASPSASAVPCPASTASWRSRGSTSTRHPGVPTPPR